MRARRELLGPVMAGLMTCGLFGGCQDDRGAPMAPSGSGGTAGAGGAAGNAGSGGAAGTITCDRGDPSGAAGEAGAGGEVEPFACTRSDAAPGAVCCPSPRSSCGQALCRTVPDLATCCFTGAPCGWVAPYFEEEFFMGCIPDVPGHPDYIFRPPPSYPSGVACVVPDSVVRPPFCEADDACPAEIPRAGSECSDIAGRCHYCNPPNPDERPSPYSRSFECTDSIWTDLGASACGEPDNAGTP
jgi:hypothetical protein